MHLLYFRAKFWTGHVPQARPGLPPTWVHKGRIMRDKATNLTNPGERERKGRPRLPERGETSDGLILTLINPTDSHIRIRRRLESIRDVLKAPTMLGTWVRVANILAFSHSRAIFRMSPTYGRYVYWKCSIVCVCMVLMFFGRCTWQGVAEMGG